MPIVKLDWKLIASVETNDILSTLDYETLQYLISNISQCNIESEMDISLDSYFVKVFKLSQNIIKYLSSVQGCLLKQIKETSEELDIEKTEKNKLQTDVDKKYRKKICNLKSELRLKEELLESQSRLIKSHQYQQSTTKPKLSNGKLPVYPCGLCDKMFESKSSLQSHFDRRHPRTNQIAPSQEPQLQQPKDPTAHDLPHQDLPVVKSKKDGCLMKQISELKSKLKETEVENEDLKVRLQHAELNGMKEMQMVGRLQKEELIRKQIKDEFDTKLELLKEEQNMEQRLCFERLQNSFMNEIKLMHIKQMEVNKTLEDVKKMRLPGNCLGMLEDDNDDGRITHKDKMARTILTKGNCRTLQFDATSQFQEEASKYPEKSTKDVPESECQKLLKNIYDKQTSTKSRRNVDKVFDETSVTPLTLIPARMIPEERQYPQEVCREKKNNKHVDTSTMTTPKLSNESLAERQYPQEVCREKKNNKHVDTSTMTTPKLSFESLAEIQYPQELYKRKKNTKHVDTSAMTSPKTSFEKLAEKQHQMELDKEPVRIISATKTQGICNKHVDSWSMTSSNPSQNFEQEDDYDDDYQMPSLEDVKRVVDMELGQRMAFYGIPNDCSEITAEKYLQIIERINSELLNLSSEDQAKYVIFKTTLEIDLESCIDKMMKKQRNLPVQINDIPHSPKKEIVKPPLKDVKSDEGLVTGEHKKAKQVQKVVSIKAGHGMSVSSIENVSGNAKEKDDNLKQKNNNNDDQFAMTTSVNNNKDDVDNDDDDDDDDDYDITTITESDVHKMSGSEDEGTLSNININNDIGDGGRKGSEMAEIKNEEILRKSVSVASSIWSSADGDSLHVEDLDALEDSND